MIFGARRAGKGVALGKSFGVFRRAGRSIRDGRQVCYALLIPAGTACPRLSILAEKGCCAAPDAKRPQNKTVSAFVAEPVFQAKAGTRSSLRLRCCLATIHVEVEVLLFELLVGAVLDDRGNRLVDLCLQVGVFLAQA